MLKRNSQYFRLGLTLLTVIILSALFIVALTNIGIVFDAVKKIIAVVSFVIGGIVFAYVMNPMLKRPYEQQRNGDMLYFDQQGNLIMYCYDKLDIYNPKGIKGYTSLLNKRTRYKAE